MTRKYLIPALASLAALGACATATPYQAATPSDRGYTNQQIEQNRWVVTFSGNSLTDRQTVETYLLYRAAELTVQNGYDNFRMVRRTTDADSNLVPVGGGYNYGYFSPYYRFYGPHGRAVAYYPYHWGAFDDPFYSRAPDYREVTRFEASAEILLGRGPSPDDPAYFDAHDVLANLSGQIMRPQAR